MDPARDTYCPFCGLDLHGADAAAMYDLLQRIGAIDAQLSGFHDERRRLVAEFEQRRLATLTYPASAPTAAPPAPAFTPAAPARAEWSGESVRSLLLWLGAALVALSALTFTAVAWSHLGDGGRASLLVLFTAVFTLLAVSLRRHLPASAQAFTGLSIVLALIDWYALRRAGIGGDISGTAWWTLGTAAVSVFALGMQRVVGGRTAGVAIAVLAPLSPELAIATYAGTAWSAALGLSLLSAALVLVMQNMHDDARPEVGALLSVHAVVTWSLAAVFSGVAAAHAHTVAASATPALVVATLALAPWFTARRADDDERAPFMAILFAVPLGAIFTLAASLFGAEGRLAFAAILGCAAVAASTFARARERGPALVAGVAFAVPGLGWSAALAVSALAGPLAWLHYPWTGSLDVAARAIFAGPRTEHAFPAAWPAVWALGAGGAACAVRAARRRDWSIPAVVMFAIAAYLVPIVGGADARVALIVSTAVACALTLAAAAFDRVRQTVSVGVLCAAVVGAVPAIGWAATTRDASVITLCAGAGSALVAALIARTKEMRAADATITAVLAVSLAGVWMSASGRGVEIAGFAVVLAASAVLLTGVHLRARTLDGIALELTGAAGMLIGLLMTTRSTPWLAGALTVVVPISVLAAMRKDRVTAYGVTATGAALGATWAWLAAAHVHALEAYTLPAAAVALAAGLLAWKDGPGRSWLTLGPAITVALGPSLLVGIAQDDTARTIGVAVAAFAVLIFGAARRLQAPLVLGAVALLVLAIDTLGPAAARLPRWVPLAVAGVLLMWIGATFERRRDDAKRATQTLMHFG